MRRRTIAAAVCVSTAIAAHAQPPREQTRQLFVRATDELDRPVAGLAAADFEVVENGVVQPVTAAHSAGGPMRIVLLVDNSDASKPSLTHIRNALQSFLDAVPAHHEIALATTGGQFRVRVPPTTDHKRLREAAGGIFSDGGAANVLVDSLIDARARFHRSAGVGWPVFVIVTTDAGDLGGASIEQQFNRFQRELAGTGTTSHAVLMSGRASGLTHLIASLLAENSGGYYQAIAASSALTGRLLEVVDRIADDEERMRSWYRLEYATKAAAAGSRTTITAQVSPPGLRLQLAVDRPLP